MFVLVLGASGFIGFPAAQALVRAGHTVYGQTRSEQKATQFAKEEIIPIICAPDSDGWYDILAKLDVVIDAVGGMAVHEISQAIYKRTSDAAARLRPAGAPKLSYIYTSGAWVHGDSRTEIFSDTAPLTPQAFVAWRPSDEQLVVTDTVLNGIVLRPATLYGRSGSLFESLFKGAKEGKAVWPGKPGQRLSLIHCDDLADLYVRLAEKAHVVGGLTFDAANGISESTDAILERLVHVSGATAYEYKEPTNLFENAVASSVILRPYLARSLLGWTPKKIGLMDGLEVYYKACVAA
ncbi:hypothetical protein BD626DRAFT_548576 [Schizophyllum amplum]|uniref:NAD-dependent epimerase/dehydratase domain-containing protein n=1 Tax=Schizophyllum amplum TaxID=97359 RepID=A0A550C574_9AGAR|nr:hypothetical protein BD626DRAFT_606481 [Auriculariopsis ampla]TRM62756.1 hypothetical protein BD626DRAFT_548576 [Auriculariopsis ampla]